MFFKKANMKHMQFLQSPSHLPLPPTQSMKFQIVILFKVSSKHLLQLGAPLLDRISLLIWLANNFLWHIKQFARLKTIDKVCPLFFQAGLSKTGGTFGKFSWKIERSKWSKLGKSHGKLRRYRDWVNCLSAGKCCRSYKKVYWVENVESQQQQQRRRQHWQQQRQHLPSESENFACCDGGESINLIFTFAHSTTHTQHTHTHTAIEV